ncbi:hypothetical protein Cfor_00564 [Coptotermes formosanus]|uniref:RNA-directed DNA polymerase n=1 Tax=Coptotermes formosanus TaxID=36987 RepID=A0A6L2QDX4_COPFO|nr:hypothetical protein Cfor_00564 [Coptotermes formosanus]
MNFHMPFIRTPALERLQPSPCKKNSAGNTNIVCTASRIFTPTEQGYTTCEEELLAIIFARNKFPIHTYGHKIYLKTEHKAFLGKCVVTSNRVVRWLLELQQYDLEIHYVTRVSNYLAGVLRRNPAGLNAAEIKNLTKPTSIMVNAIDLKINHAICKDVRNLGTLQRAYTRLQKIIEGITPQPTAADQRYLLVGDVLYCRENGQSAVWKPMMPSRVQDKVIKYVHHSLGHSGIEKCIFQVTQECHIPNLWHKVRKFVACCDTCQKVKHPNKTYDTEERSHLPSKPGELCAIDLYGSLPTSLGGGRYLLSAATKLCLDKLIHHYFVQVTKPDIILSDNGTQFQSPAWKRTLTSHGVQIRYTAIRNPHSNPAESCMREISKFSRIYSHETHKRWAELVPHTEFWMNNTLASPTGREIIRK